MRGRFVILQNGRLETYVDYDHIPMRFDNLIEFRPDHEEGPHSDDQHRDMASMQHRLAMLMQRETNASGY